MFGIFDGAYNAGWRAGMIEPGLKMMGNGTTTLSDPECPFPSWRFLSRFYWYEGLLDGQIERLSGNEGALPPAWRFDVIGVLLFIALLLLLRALTS